MRILFEIFKIIYEYKEIWAKQKMSKSYIFLLEKCNDFLFYFDIAIREPEFKIVEKFIKSKLICSEKDVLYNLRKPKNCHKDLVSDKNLLKQYFQKLY